MKITILLLTLTLSILLTSCYTSSYYQVYNVKPTDNRLVVTNKLIKYEDENCIISYNFWEDGGDIGFDFYNKTAENIYLFMDESFFIRNGVAYNYYQNRVYTRSTNSGTALSRGASASKSVTGVNNFELIQTNRISALSSSAVYSSDGFSVSYPEEKIICIPSMTKKRISQYFINKTVWRDCELIRYPNKKTISPISFTEEDSPLIFSNIICYSVGKNEQILKIKNEFLVTEITNYPDYLVITTAYEEYCGQKSERLVKLFNNVAPNKFYIEYKKGNDNMTH